MKLEYSEIEKGRKLNTIVEIICAAILGCACFYVFISMFRLTYGTGTMASGGFGRGLAGIWNGIAETLGNASYTILPRYAAATGADAAKGYGLALTVFLIMFSVLSYLIIKSRIRPLLLIFVIPVIVLITRYGVAPSAYSGAAFGAAIIIALTVMGIKGRMKPEYFIVPLVAVLLASAAVFALDKTVSLDEPKDMAASGAKARASMEKSRYGTDALPAGDVGSISGKELRSRRGDIEKIKEALGTAGTGYDPFGSTETSDIYSEEESYEDEAEQDESSEKDDKDAALTVTMSQPESYYLRGFVGAEFSKNRWNTFPNNVFYSMRDDIFWLNRRGFDGLSEMSYAKELSDSSAASYTTPSFSTETSETTDTQDTASESETESVKIKVEVKNASKKIAFTPYEMILKPAKGKKARKSEMKLPAGTKNYGGSYLGTEGYSGKSSYNYTAAPNITGSWTDAVGQFYTTDATEEINNFFISESHYNVSVYDKYLDLPDRYSEAFATEIGSPGDLSEEHADYKVAIETISTYLRDRYIYSEAFSRTKAENDFVQSFIESKKGSDIHFATLATLMFRYYGIPARYVEGYLVTPSLIEGKSGKTKVNVPKAANHAWTEIYIDGFGWVPIEATPEYSGIMQEADMTKGLQNVAYENPSSQNEDNENESPQSEDNKENNNLVRLLIRLLIIFLIAVISVLLLILLVLLGKMLASWHKWRKAFKDKDPKVGVKAMYQYSKEKNWTLSQLGEKLGLIASYSQYKMEEKDRARMQKEMDTAREKAKKEEAEAKAKAKAEKEAAKAAARKRAAEEKAEKEAAKAEMKKAKAEAEAAKKKAEEEAAAAKARAEAERERAEMEAYSPKKENPYEN